MFFNEFKYQDKQKKKQLLFNHGVYLAQRPSGEFIILLFQIDSFYAEVYFDTEEEQIGYIRTFTSVNDLEPYLQQVDISPLLAAC